MKPFLTLIMALVISISLTPLAYAEYTPTQPDANLSYDSTTSDLTITWDFDSLSDTARCAAKGDFSFSDDVQSDDAQSYVTVTSFIPVEYSPFGSNSTLIEEESDVYAEEVSCNGTFTMNMESLADFSDDLEIREMLIFITFYILNDDGSFSISGDFLLDELLITYAPTSTFDQDFLDWACNDQVGNVIFVGQDGTYGNNGENCEQLLELESEEECCDFSAEETTTDDTLEATLNDLTVVVEGTGTNSTKTLTVDLFTSNPQSTLFDDTPLGNFYEIELTGADTLDEITITITYSDADVSGLDESTLVIYRFSDGDDEWTALTTTVDATNNIATATTTGFSTFALGGSESSSSETNTSGGGCSGDCVKPTFGKNTYGKQIVQGGFSFNGNATDVTAYWTPYKMITAQTNTTHNFTFKVFENWGNNNIKWFQFGIVPEVGTPLNHAEVLATIYMKSSEIEKIIKVDKNNLWDIINATSYAENCGYVNSDCLELSLDVMFRDELKNKVIVIQAMDNPRNSDTKFLNEGIDTVGESMNEPLISSVSAGKGSAFYPQRAGSVELTLVDYKTDSWQDEYGYMWTSDNYKSFRIVDTIPVPIKEPDVIWSAMTRINSNFEILKQIEIQKALYIFDSSEIQSDLPLSFTIVISGKIDKLQDPIVLQKMKIEEQKAQLYLDEMFH